MIEFRQDSMHHLEIMQQRVFFIHQSFIIKGKEYEGIPGSSERVKLVPFHPKNLPKNRNFTYMEDPGMSKHFFFVFLSTADKIFAATDGRPCLPATAAAGAVGGCGGSISHTIHGTYSIFAYMIG